MQKEHELESGKNYYLKNFRRMNDENEALLCWPKTPEIGKKITNLLKEEDLTYEEAYASLQYAYNLLRYESNFLKLGD